MKLSGTSRELQETFLLQEIEHESEPDESPPTPSDTIRDSFESLTDSEKSEGDKKPRNQAWIRLLMRDALQVLILATVVAVLMGSLTLVRLERQKSLGAPPDRVRCLQKGVNATQCLGAGCLWSPQRDGPSCLFPPASLHGYSIIASPEKPAPGVTRFRLALKNTSARVVQDLKEELLLQMIEYGEDIFRIKITVPGEARYEVPVPLDLPDIGNSKDPKYTVSFGAPGRDFSIVVKRPTTGAAMETFY